jgi:formylglycine-generating enzyme required for sulfatase activity
MNARRIVFIAALLAAQVGLASGRSRGSAADRAMARVGPGQLRPVYLPEKDLTEVRVEGFLLDRTAVTNAQFLAFVKAHPAWRREQVKPLFAEDNYLARWAAPMRLGPAAPPDAPVVQVSWFAARAYCEARGARLPTENEWEYAAQSGMRDPQMLARILSWYGEPTPKVLPAVGQGAPSPEGVRDLHGLVWEWVEDFNDTLVSADSRAGDDSNRLGFCGAGALAAGNRSDYAGFMRVAFRSSLEGRFTLSNLGFRCAQDLPGDAR